MTDWQLIQSYLAGNEEAFASLVQKYYCLVYGTACRQVSDSHLAEDVTQCVFLLFARKAKAMSSDTAIGGWFLRTVRFVARDVARKRRRWRQLEEEDLMENIEMPTLNPTGPLFSLEEAILALSAKEQICVLAKYYEGKNFKEIALDQDISEDAAQKRVSRALDKMRDFFQRRGFRVSTAAIPAIFSAGFLASAREAVAQTGVVLAAVKGNAVSDGAAALAAEATRVLTRKYWLALGSKVAAALLLIGSTTGWIWVNHTPPIPPRPLFQVWDGRIIALGKTWDQIMQRAARVRREFPDSPAIDDPRLPALRAENISLFHDRMVVSQELHTLSAEQNVRMILPAYVTSGLGELLALNSAQQAFAFDFVQQFLPEGVEEKDATALLEVNKPAIAAAVRDTLSIRQRWRFDEVCGREGEFLLINRTSYGRAPGYMAWQDWLGKGGIITPAEAMEAVPPHLW
jgi:RNA polymerase sigma factor (sigma-70 family)